MCVAVSRTLAWGGLVGLVVLCAWLVSANGLWMPALQPIVAGQFDPGPAFYAGFHGVEQAADGTPYRWTMGAALVQVRGAFYATPTYLAAVRLRGGNPTGPQPLTLLAGGHPVATVMPEVRFRTYRLLLAEAGDGGGELWLGLQTPVFQPAGDPRALGVMLTDVTLKPLSRPDLPRGLATALGLVALWVILRALGVHHGSALGLVALASLGLTALVSLPRPPVAPLPLLAALTLAGVAGAVLVAHQTPARLGLAALTLLVTLSGRIWPPWLSDDAFISFRYAQNFVQGHGLVYNLGERVEGYTNFLWTILAALVIQLGGDVVVWSHLAGVALGVALVLLTYGFGARLAGSPWGLLAALIVGTSQSLLLYTGRGSGLETGLFTLLLLAASERYLRAGGSHLAASGALAPWPLVATGVLLALAALTRPEGLLVFGLTAGHLFVVLLVGAYKRGRGLRVFLALPWRPLVALVGAFLALFLPYFLWRLNYYGDLLPNTFYAKTGGGLNQVLRGLAYAGAFAITLGGPLLLVALVPWISGWRAALVSWRGYMLPVVLVYTAYIVVVGGDHFRGERFFVPLLPWLAMLLADGSAWLAVWVGTRTTNSARLVQTFTKGALALSLAAGALAAVGRTAPFDPTIQGLDESVWIWRDLGWWMADHAPPEATLAAAGAGAVAYYGQHTTIDLYGLTEKHIGRLTMAGMGEGVAGHEKRDPLYVLTVRKPTYIPQLWEAYFGGAASLAGDYRLSTVTTRTGRELQLWVRQP